MLDNKLPEAEKIYNTGILHYQKGGFEEAINSFDKVIELIPEHSYSYYFIGLIMEQQGKAEEAITNYSKAIKFNPDDPDFYNNLGMILQEQGNLNQAIENYLSAIRINPDNSEYHNNLGVAYMGKKQANEAIINYKKAIDLESDNPEYYNNLGLAIMELRSNDIEETGHNIKKNLKTFKLSGCFDLISRMNKNGEEAISNYQKAIQFNSDNPEFYNNLGIALYYQGNYYEAIKMYKKAIHLDQQNVKYLNNLATVFDEIGKYKEAFENYNLSLAIEPENLEVKQNLSLLYLQHGNFEKGWREYENSRLKMPMKKYLKNKLNKPDWDGSDLKGKTIYVCAEQGFGDALHFVRYLPLVKERGGKVIFNCKPALKKVLETCEGYDLIVSNPVNKETNQFDTFTFLMSLPGIFNTKIDSIPADIPYLKANPGLKEKWREKLNNLTPAPSPSRSQDSGHKSCVMSPESYHHFKDKGNKNVGFTWKSGFPNSTFNKRSCSIENFYELAKEIPDITFYSLQQGPFTAQLETLPQLPNIINLAEEITDFTDTAAIIENLDLVISIDTSVIHLAGALGKPVWTLLSFSSDWRWLLDREDTPWYPTMRLFRQPEIGNWEPVFKKIKNELLKLIILTTDYTDYTDFTDLHR